MGLTLRIKLDLIFDERFLVLNIQSLRQSDPGAAAVSQPDNAEQVLQLQRGEEEACLLIGRDRWEVGVWWDDAACYTEEEFICEDSTDLLTRAGINKPVVFG